MTPLTFLPSITRLPRGGGLPSGSLCRRAVAISVAGHRRPVTTQRVSRDPPPTERTNGCS